MINWRTLTGAFAAGDGPAFAPSPRALVHVSKG
jgi:hypothetical protein